MNTVNDDPSTMTVKQLRAYICANKLSKNLGSLSKKKLLALCVRPPPPPSPSPETLPSCTSSTSVSYTFTESQFERLMERLRV
jgi:hypothetical protein